MSKKELERKALLEAHKCGLLTLKEIEARVGISYRQIKRIWQKYKIKGDPGLLHGNRCKTPKNAYSKEFKGKVLKLYQDKYFEFGPTYTSEKLLEDDGIPILAETLRLWLKENGLWSRKRKRKVHREKRARRACFGELLQIDGSIHRWFVDDDNHYCLLNMVDDATGISMAMLDKGETTKILLTVFMKWIKKYGIPKEVYVDLKSVYVGRKYLKERYDDDFLNAGFSVFEQVCRNLNIRIIKAYSPQAKGRVERKHGVYQDRLVKDLKLYGIKTIDGANEYLEKFIIKINNKFAKSPEEVSNAHRDNTLYGNLDEILCWQYKRQLRNDWTIVLNNEYFQIKEGYEEFLKPKDIVLIKKYLNGETKLWVQDVDLTYEKLIQKPEPPSRTKKYQHPKGCDRLLRSKLSRKNKHRTPWSGLNWKKTGS